MTRVRISEDALRDLQDGYWFYEAQEPGLGITFFPASATISRASRSLLDLTASFTAITVAF